MTSPMRKLLPTSTLISGLLRVGARGATEFHSPMMLNLIGAPAFTALCFLSQNERQLEPNYRIQTHILLSITAI